MPILNESDASVNKLRLPGRKPFYDESLLGPMGQGFGRHWISKVNPPAVPVEVHEEIPLCSECMDKPR